MVSPQAYTYFKPTTHMAVFVRALILVAMALPIERANGEGVECWVHQEPDPDSGNKYRWLIPVPEPCACTVVGFGGLSTAAPRRPFKVVYHDGYVLGTDVARIRQWLRCPDPCLSVPCQNGATCTTDASLYAYTCICPAGFHGTNCQNADIGMTSLGIDPCLFYPCPNGATCTTDASLYTYTCICPAGFHGTNCQYADIVTPCSVNPCGLGVPCEVSHDVAGEVIRYVCHIAPSCDKDPFCILAGGTCGNYSSGYQCLYADYVATVTCDDLSDLCAEVGVCHYEGGFFCEYTQASVCGATTCEGGGVCRLEADDNGVRGRCDDEPSVRR